MPAGGFSKGFSNGYNVYTFNITTSTLPDVGYNIAYTTQLLADEIDPTWTLISGVLPSGLSLSASGEISGTSTDTGSHPVTVRASSTFTTEIDEAAYTMIVLSSSAGIGWERWTSVYNFRLLRRF